MRIAFMGTPAFSLPPLKALIEAGHDIVAVYSQPPRRAGRGKKVTPSPVHKFAEEAGLEVFTPGSLKNTQEKANFKALNIDVAVVVAYGLILPPEFIHTPPMGCINIHASLLPRWRGAAPIQRAIMAGDAETGVDIMIMEEGLDTGPVIMQRKFDILPHHTAGELHDILSALGGEMIVPALTEKFAPRPQDDTHATYAPKIDKAEAEINWSRPAMELRNHIHGLSPFPGAWTEVEGERVKILQAEIADSADDRTFNFTCGDGKTLTILRAQRAGKKPMSGKEVKRGFQS